MFSLAPGTGPSEGDIAGLFLRGLNFPFECALLDDVRCYPDSVRRADVPDGPPGANRDTSDYLTANGA